MINFCFLPFPKGNTSFRWVRRLEWALFNPLSAKSPKILSQRLRLSGCWVNFPWAAGTLGFLYKQGSAAQLKQHSTKLRIKPKRDKTLWAWFSTLLTPEQCFFFSAFLIRCRCTRQSAAKWACIPVTGLQPVRQLSARCALSSALLQCAKSFAARLKTPRSARIRAESQRQRSTSEVLLSPSWRQLRALMSLLSGFVRQHVHMFNPLEVSLRVQLVYAVFIGAVSGWVIVGLRGMWPWPLCTLWLVLKAVCNTQNFKTTLFLIPLYALMTSNLQLCSHSRKVVYYIL